MSTDFTHDASLRSWVASANDDASEFPIQNLPFARFRPAAGADDAARIGVAIGDMVLDFRRAADAGIDFGPHAPALARGHLNALMSSGAASTRQLRHALVHALREGSPMQAQLAPCLVPQNGIAFELPCSIGDYTDFYTGIHHATTVGKLFRPDNPLLPNYKWLPIGYHGRASSLMVSGHAFRRPVGQLPAEGAPRFGPCERLDYELELGVLVGTNNPLGESRSMVQADEDWFGMVLLNDWSARDIQSWEYQPLGPFLSKNFATTISPWVVTRDALEPFREPFRRPAGDPQPLPYLDSSANRDHGAVSIDLEVWLQTPAMTTPHRLTTCNFRDAYWTVAQLIAHHTVNGCNLQAGDLLGSGTQSGPNEGEGGSLLELTRGGRQAIELPNGESRRFLEDGDTVILRAHAQGSGRRRIGFGECRATVAPAR